MKKILSILAMVTLAFTLISGMEVKAAEVSGSLTGPSTAKPGDTITLSLNVNAPQGMGANGQITYDSAKATINSTSTSVSGWGCDFNSSTAEFIVYDNNATGVNGLQTIMTVNVTLATGLVDGESVTFSISNCAIPYDNTNFLESAINVSCTVKIVNPVTEDTSSTGSTSTGSTSSGSTSSGSTSSGSTSSGSTSSESATTGSTTTGSTTTGSTTTGSTTTESTTTDNATTDSTTTDSTTSQDTTTDNSTTANTTVNDKTENLNNVSKDVETNENQTEAESSSAWIWVVAGVVIVLAIIGCLLFFFIKKRKTEEQSE